MRQLICLQFLRRWAFIICCINIIRGEHVTQITGTCSGDFLFHDGAAITANPVRSIRSGNPKQNSSVRITSSILSGDVVKSFAFSYRYITGYGPSGIGSNFTVLVAGKPVYVSPNLVNFSYDSNRSGYSPPQKVIFKEEIILKENETNIIKILFTNNDRNIQLMLPMTFNLTCRSPPCSSTNVWRPVSAPIVVFNSGDKDENNITCNCFRIPAISKVKFDSRSLLAFAEGRYASCKPDVRPENRIVLRRSLDEFVGKSWSPIHVLYPKIKYQNYPTPIVDKENGVVHIFFYGSSPSTMYYANSTDGGLSWSDVPVNMTEYTGFRMGMAGGGGGVQLESGRLVFPCDIPGGRASCYSDDQGKTWKRGFGIPLGPNVHNLNEASLVSDGRFPNSLAMFIRVSSRSYLQNHALALSVDGGYSWGPAVLIPEIVGPTCQGSIGRRPEGKIGEILMSAPYSTDGSLNGRENLYMWSTVIDKSRDINSTAPYAVNKAGSLWRCKGAYTYFGENGEMNLFESGLDYRYSKIQLQILNTSHDKSLNLN